MCISCLSIYFIFDSGISHFSLLILSTLKNMPLEFIKGKKGLDFLGHNYFVYNLFIYHSHCIIFMCYILMFIKLFKQFYIVIFVLFHLIYLHLIDEPAIGFAFHLYSLIYIHQIVAHTITGNPFQSICVL